MLDFKRIEDYELIDKNYILLYEYYHNTDDNIVISDVNKQYYLFYDEVLKKETTVFIKIDSIYKDIYSIGEELFTYLMDNEKFDLDVDFFNNYNNIKRMGNQVLQDLKHLIDYWISKNGFPYFKGFSCYQPYYTCNELALNMTTFIKDTISVYVLSRTHEILYDIECLSGRKTNYGNEYNNKIDTLLLELEELRCWHLSYGLYLYENVYSSKLIKNHQLRKMGILNPDYGKNKINLNDFIPVIELENSIFSDSDYIIDISLLYDNFSVNNLLEISSVLNGLAIIYTYQQIYNYEYLDEPYNKIRTTHSQSFDIKYEQIIFDKDRDIYRNYTMAYSLMGIAYYKLLIQLTSNIENGGYNMVKCQNPNCNNYFEKQGNKKYCDNKECQAYRKRKKSNAYYQNKKKKFNKLN